MSSFFRSCFIFYYPSPCVACNARQTRCCLRSAVLPYSVVCLHVLNYSQVLHFWRRRSVLRCDRFFGLVGRPYVANAELMRGSREPAAAARRDRNEIDKRAALHR